MRLIGLRTAAIQFNKGERTLRRWVAEGMKHRRDSKKYIWFEPWVVVAWVRYKALVDNGLEQRRRAAGFELTDEEKQRIIKTWIRAGGKLPGKQ